MNISISYSYSFRRIISNSLGIQHRYRPNSYCTATSKRQESSSKVEVNARKKHNKPVKYVYQGDSTSKEAYRATGLGVNLIQADVIITDPPYCLLERRRTGGDLRDPKARKRKLDDQPTVPRFESVLAYKAFTSLWLPLTIQLAAKRDATIIIWTNALGKAPIMSVASSLGYDMVGEYLWAKRTADAKENSTKNEVLLRIYESALVFQPTAIAHITKAKQYQADEVKPIWSVVTGYQDDSQALGPHPHPCHKPLAALEPLLRQWTKPGDLIFDPFTGSGGILQAVVSIGQRQVLGIEKLEEWTRYANDAIVKQVHENQNK